MLKKWDRSQDQRTTEQGTPASSAAEEQRSKFMFYLAWVSALATVGSLAVGVAQCQAPQRPEPGSGSDRQVQVDVTVIE